MFQATWIFANVRKLYVLGEDFVVKNRVWWQTTVKEGVGLTKRNRVPKSYVRFRRLTKKPFTNRFCIPSLICQNTLLKLDSNQCSSYRLATLLCWLFVASPSATPYKVRDGPGTRSLHLWVFRDYRCPTRRALRTGMYLENFAVALQFLYICSNIDGTLQFICPLYFTFDVNTKLDTFSHAWSLLQMNLQLH